MKFKGVALPKPPTNLKRLLRPPSPPGLQLRSYTYRKLFDHGLPHLLSEFKFKIKHLFKVQWWPIYAVMNWNSAVTNEVLCSDEFFTFSLSYSKCYCFTYFQNKVNWMQFPPDTPKNLVSSECLFPCSSDFGGAYITRNIPSL